MINCILIFMMSLSSLVICQTSDQSQIIRLAEYHSNYFFGDLDQDSLENIEKNLPSKFNFVGQFTKEVVSANNDLLSTSYLKIPDTFSLKVIHIISCLVQNPSKLRVYDEGYLVDSLLGQDIYYHELVDSYYYTLFRSVAQKNRNSNSMELAVNIDSLDFSDNTSKGIFFLRCMESYGKLIRGYIYLSSEPKFSKAFSEINKFPKFNGESYYEVMKLEFDDFQIEVYNDSGLRSYKDYFVGKYFDVLYAHLITLFNLNEPNEDIMNLWNNSILSNKNLYEHTKLKDELMRVAESR